MIASIILLKASLYTSKEVYCEIYTLIESNTEEFNFNIPLKIYIYCTECVLWREDKYMVKYSVIQIEF